nr:MAG TPA: anaerobic ribonucleoside triphosphate reductase [Caudoviricetes sp.]
MFVDIKLDNDFIEKISELYTKYGDKLANLNGLSAKYLNFTDFIDNFVDSKTVADVSVDGNANVGHKDIVTLLNEMAKPQQKLLAYNKIYYEITKKYGKDTASKWLEKEWTKALYLHDSNTSTFKSYCYAYDLKRLAEEGLFFIENFNAEPPKHLGTFVDFVKEFVSYCSNRTSGACGLPNLIPYMYYFWDRDVKNGYYTKDPKSYAKQHIQRFIYAVNQPCVRDGMQSAFTNTNVFDRPYLKALFGGAEFPDGSFMIDEIEQIVDFQWLFLETMSEIRSHNMFTFPVNTISLLKQNGKFVDEEFARKASKHNMKWTDSNIFADSSVNSLSNCCRLKSSIKDLGYFNSIGGSALRVGSIKVSTINLARIALKNNNEEDYLRELAETTLLNLKVLDCVRTIIKRNIEKGLLPNYCDGLIDIDTQYNTTGVLGIYETMKTFGYTTIDEFGNTFYKPEAYTFGEKIFKTIHNVQTEFGKDKNYMINIEAVPAEQAAAKMQLADEMFYPDTVVKDLPLYGNQFIPLGIKTTLQERVKIAAAFDSYCNGG